MGPELLLAGQAAGGVISVVGALMEGDAKAKGFAYKASVARMNAEIAKQNKEWALRTGEKEAIQTGQKTAQMIGAQKVAQAAGNLDVAVGSPAEVRESQRTIGLKDQTTIRENAGRRAYGFDIEAEKHKAEAGMYDVASTNARTASYFKAAGSVLGSATSVAGKWSEGQQYGMLNQGGGSEGAGATYW